MSSEPSFPYEPVDWSRTRFSEWLVKSKIARAMDELVGAVGISLLGLSLMDTIATFWSNTVLIAPASLERISGILLIPTWPWIILSAWTLSSASRGNRRRPLGGLRPTWRAVAPYAVAFGATVLVLVIGFILGAAKGSLRILPGGIHQVSTLDLNQAEWTTVPASTYRLWAARFVREDAFFAIFGLAMVAYRAGTHTIRRRHAANKLNPR